MKTLPVEKAVGTVLCHDITQIIPGRFKGAAFRKGQVIKIEDIPKLLDMGKQHVYVYDPADGFVHENQAAVKIAVAAAGANIRLTKPSEGRVNLLANIRGLLKINVEALNRINSIEDVVFSTLHTYQTVRQGQPLAGTRVVPLAVREETLQKVEKICLTQAPIISVLPFRSVKVGLVTTGSEIYSGRIKDRFGPVLKEKFDALGSQIVKQIFVSDQVDMTVAAIDELIADGVDMITLSGGMSVDPDDQTPSAIRAAGAKVVTYGAPVLPGAMFMLAHIGQIPVLGLPGCVMYNRASIFDLVVPRILAGEPVLRDDLVALGHGGFCAGCENCRYPLCSFGKGSSR